MFNSKKFFATLLSVVLFLPAIAKADVAGLTPCKESPVFTKRLEASVRKLEGRLAKYEQGTPPAIALEQQIDRTKQRFARYSDSGLLCGKDGLPHLITDGRWSHSVEFVIPGMLFLYISGWIGWVGRKYVRAVAQTANPAQQEIIIDVPLALKIMSGGFLWPVSAWQEYVSGGLLAKDSEVTVSPR